MDMITALSIDTVYRFTMPTELSRLLIIALVNLN